MSETHQLPRVLFVDDQERLLEGLGRQVRGFVDASLMSSPLAAAATLRESEGSNAFAVIVSDMRMPEMDGATLLREAKSVCPETARVLLTGYSDINHAMAAVNEGNVFRFLMKPCSTPVLRAALEDAIEQHKLLVERRELVEKTLRGAVEALVEALTMTHPSAFARASRLRGLARSVAEILALPDSWEIEVAAQLGELGVVTLPPEALDALVRGTTPNSEIADMLSQLPAIADDILGRIPRLEGVREIVRAQQPVDRPDRMVLARSNEASRVLQAIREYDALTAQGYPPNNAIGVIRQHAAYAPNVIDALRQVAGATSTAKVHEVDVSYLRPGLVLAADIRSRRGMLLVKSGHVLTTELLTRIRNFERLGGLEGIPMILSEE